MEKNTSGVVLPHHTYFCLGQGVALPDAYRNRPVAAAGVTLHADVAVAVGVPRGISCVCCPRYMCKAPFTLCHTSVTGIACT